MPDLIDTAMVIARVSWRNGAGGEGHDAEFERIWNDELRTKVAPLIKDGAIEPALPILRSLQARATEARPRLEAAKRLDTQMENAKGKFISGGGLEAEWQQERDAIRRELLRRSALDDRDQKIETARKHGYRIFDAKDVF